MKGRRKKPSSRMLEGCQGAHSDQPLSPCSPFGLRVAPSRSAVPYGQGLTSAARPGAVIASGRRAVWLVRPLRGIEQRAVGRYTILFYDIRSWLTASMALGQNRIRQSKDQ